MLFYNIIEKKTLSLQYKTKTQKEKLYEKHQHLACTDFPDRC